MKGDTSRATTAMQMMADRHPGSARAARTPSAIRRAMDRWPDCGTGGGRCTRSSAITTAPNDAALMPNTIA